MSTQHSINIKRSFFLLCLMSYYYTFMLFPVIKELSASVDLPEIHIYIKIFFLLFFFFSFSIFIKYSKNNNFKLNIYIFYSLLHLLFLLFIMKYNITYIIKSFYDTFGVIFVGFIFFYINSDYISIKNTKKFLQVFIALYFLILIYGYLQYFFNSPLLYYDFDFYYISETIHKIRALSILPSRIQYGKITAIIASLMFFLIINKKQSKNIIYLSIMILSLIGTYFSTERASMLLFLVFIFNSILIRLNFSFKKIIFFNLISSFLIPIFLFNITISYSLDNSLFRTNSLIDRLYWWGHIFNTYVINGELSNIILGYGIIQTTDLTSFSAIYTNGKLWIDNLYLVIFLYQGIIGLILFLYFYINYLYKLYSLNTFYSKYFALLLLSWLISGVFARSIGDIALFSLVPSIIYFKIVLRKNINA